MANSNRKNIVIGFDQSYSNFGVGIAVDGKLKIVKSIDLSSFKSPSEKRIYIRSIVYSILEQNSAKGNVVIYCERIRQMSQKFLSIPYIKATAALIAVIVDVAFEFGVEVRSVDTRAWKSKVLGTSKGSKALKSDGWSKEQIAKLDERKIPAIRFINSKGFYPEKQATKKLLVPDDDACDAGCITLYGCLPIKEQLYKVEQ